MIATIEKGKGIESMACEGMLSPEQTLAQRKAELTEALAMLEAALTANAVTVDIGRNGAVSFKGWKPDARKRMNDACAFQRLTASKSVALRRAVERAEVLQGRKVDERKILAGVHSHDGGKSWGKH